MHKNFINYSDQSFASKNSCYLDPKRKAMAKLAYNGTADAKNTRGERLKNWLLKCWNRLFLGISK